MGGRSLGVFGSLPLLRGDSFREDRIFWTVLLIFLAINTILPVFCQWNYRSDVLEQIMIGREWCLASNRHPSFPTWLVQIFWLALNRTEVTPYLAA